jgi:hypothetical protein
MKSFGLLCWCLFTVAAAAAQSATISRFTAEQHNDGVLVKWSVGAGQTCNSVTVERSHDSLFHFQPLYTYPGVCGNTQLEESYSYSDQSPQKNTVNYYRLNLGSLGFTAARPVWFGDYGNDGYVLTQNPVGHQAVIRFRNENNGRFVFRLFNAAGVLVMQRHDVDGDEISIDTRLLAKGLYAFQLTENDGVRYDGKLTVQ